jgi:hypothetical protein
MYRSAKSQNQNKIKEEAKEDPEIVVRIPTPDKEELKQTPGAQCWACRKMGHLSPDCVVTKTGMACRNCGKVGHLAKICQSSKK